MSSTNAAEFPATPNHETVPILATPTGVAEKIEPDGEQQDTPNSPSPKPTTPERETPQPKKEQPEWEIRTLPDAFKNAEAPPWIIKDLVMSGTLTLVSAQPHGMKSLSWLAACMEGVHKKQVFRHFEAPKLNNVLFIETEDPEWLVKKRIQGLAQGLKLSKGAELQGFHYTCPGPFELIKQQKQLEQLRSHPFQ